MECKRYRCEETIEALLKAVEVDPKAASPVSSPVSLTPSPATSANSSPNIPRRASRRTRSLDAFAEKAPEDQKAAEAAAKTAEAAAA